MHACVNVDDPARNHRAHHRHISITSASLKIPQWVVNSSNRNHLQIKKPLIVTGLNIEEHFGVDLPGLYLDLQVRHKPAGF